MLISLTHRFVFIANLKTASTAIEIALRPMSDIALVEAQFGKHQPFTWINKNFKWLFDTVGLGEFFIFGVIRDPVDFAISLYNSHKDPKFRNFPHTYTALIDFDEFLTTWAVNHPQQLIEQHTRFMTEQGTIAANYVISYHDLVNGLRFVSDEIKIPELNNLPRENVSVNEFTRRELTTAHLAWINEHFRNDLEFMQKWCNRPLTPATRSPRHRVTKTPPGKEREMVTRDQVVYAYRFFFGRDPESETVIQRWLRLPDWANLREAFLNSEEFQHKFGARLAAQTPHEFLLAAPNRVDVEVSEEHFARLLNHVRQAWEALGARQPHWSVLTDPRFLPDNVGANLDKFYQSGAQSWKLFECSLSRTDLEPPSDWTVFELGCGVGRVTAQLASRFSHVTACDISRLHLDIAINYLQRADVDNVECLHLNEISVLDNLEPFDLFYSIIVLQHNPPPLMYRMLKTIFSKIRNGGFAYFQIPVAAKNYEFLVDKYLQQVESGEAVMEMHVLPQPHLFRLIDEGSLRIVDLQRDNLTGPGFHSITVLAEKIENRPFHAG